VGQLVNVLAGLATTLLGYIIGRVWQRVVDQIPYRRARVFWRPLFTSQIQVVVSRFESPSFNEPTGLVGGGDAIALREISAYLSRIGFRKHKVVYVDEAGLDRKNNLILLGGPDANAVTRDALKLIGARFQLVDPGPGHPAEIRDTAPVESHATLSGARTAVRAYAPTADTDYGVVIRARNPFNPEKWLVIFAGAYGYGTWGGVELALSDHAFLRQCLDLQHKHGGSHWRRLTQVQHYRLGNNVRRRAGSEPVQLECLFLVRVYDRRPYACELVVPPRLLSGDHHSAR
jgi:hypothetical protein